MSGLQSRLGLGVGSGRHEVSGAFGDVGILIPLALSLILVNGLNPTSVFLGVGLVYILSGLYFGIPMPVQPLKAVASIAVAGAIAPDLIGAAGLLIGVILLLLSITGAIGLVARIVSVRVIKGIQLSLGLLLMKAGLDLVLQPKLIASGQPTIIYLGGLAFPAGVVIALVGLAVIIALLRRPMLPASAVLLAAGLPLGVALGGQAIMSWSDLGPVMPAFALPSPAALGTAFFLLVIPQLPLTLGNSILSTADVAQEYYGERAARVTPRALCLSIGLANLGAGLVGGLPVCHGAGGLTAHHRFGARTPLASIIIGGTCLVLALVFGRAVVPLLSAMPYAILGALLLYVGWRHLGLVARVRESTDFIIVFLVAAISLSVNNLAIGVAIGVAADWGLVYLLSRLREQPVTVANSE